MSASIGSGAHKKGNSEHVTINGILFPVYTYDYVRENHFGYVYVTINLINGMKYIGIAYKKSGSRAYLGSGTYLKNAIKYYGKTNFKKYIIDFSEDRVSLEKLEVEYIRYRFGVNCANNSGWYNITDGLQHGGNHWIGLSDEKKEELKKAHTLSLHNWYVSHPEEVQHLAQETSIFMKDYYSNPVNRRKVSLATKEGMNTPEVRAKLHRHHVLTKPKKPVTSEARANMSLAQKKRFNSSNVWNKGKHMTINQRKSLMYAQSSLYHIYIDDFSFYIRTKSIVQLTVFLQVEYDLKVGKNKVRLYLKDDEKHLIYTISGSSIYLLINKVSTEIDSSIDILDIVMSDKYSKLRGR